MNVYRRFLYILRHRGEDLLLFEITMRAIGALVGAFVSLSVPHIINFKVNSIDGVALWSPQYVFFICLFTISVVLLLYLALIEVVGLCHIAHSTKRHDRPSTVATLRFAAKKALHIVHAYGLTAVLLVFVGVLIFPILNINPRLFEVFDLPVSLIKDSVGFQVGGALRVIWYVFLIYIGFRSIFTFPIFASKKHSLLESVKESWSLTRLHKKPHELLAWSVLVPILLTLIFFIASLAVLFVGIGLVNSLVGILFSVLPQHISIILFASWVYVMTAILSVLVAPVALTALCAYIEVRMPRVLGMDSSHSLEHLPHHMSGWKFLHKKINVVMIGLGAFILFTMIVYQNIQVWSPSANIPMVISHRGVGSTENTLASFKNAIDLGTNGIETDIQQLADGTLVVFHDQTLKRLYDNSEFVASSTQDTLNAEHIDILTFDRLLLYIQQVNRGKTKDNCTRWLLEIKAYQGSQSVVRIGSEIYKKIKVYDALSCVYVGSFDQQAIVDLEMMYPDMQTNMYLIGRPEDPERAARVDAFTIEHTILSQFTAAEFTNKDIFVWTVNALNDIKTVVDLGVRGVITDRIDLVDSYLSQSYAPNIGSDSPDIVRIFGTWFKIQTDALWKFNIRYAL